MNLYKATLWPRIDPNRKIDPHHVYPVQPNNILVLAEDLEDALEKTKENYADNGIVIEEMNLVHSRIDTAIGWNTQ